MQQMVEQAVKLYPEFQANYQEMVCIGEKFLKDKVLRTWQIGQFCRARDGASYYLYRYFPELFQEVFQSEPILPRVPVWHHILHQVMYIPEKLLNNVWWPKFGPQVETYMLYYLEHFKLAIHRLENEYVIPDISPSEDQSTP